MRKEIKLIKRYCDCCRIEEDAPVAIVGYSSSVGWTVFKDMDFCGICISQINTESRDKLSNDDFDAIFDRVKEFRKNTTANINVHPFTYTG